MEWKESASLLRDLGALRARAFGQRSADQFQRDLPVLTGLIGGHHHADPSSAGSVEQALRSFLTDAAARLPPDDRAAVIELFNLASRSGRPLRAREEDAAALRHTTYHTQRQEPARGQLLRAYGAAIMQEADARRRYRALGEDNRLQVMRHEYLASAARILSSTRLLCLWGEPGTGKSVLAMQLAESYDARFFRVRVGDPRVLHMDLLEVMRLIGFEPTNWSPAFCAMRLREQLADESSRLPGLILDGIENKQDFAIYVPDTCSVPVIVTSRQLHLRSSGASMQVTDFSRDQAREYVAQRLPATSSEELEHLLDLLGGRPLALTHAVELTEAIPTMTLGDLVRMARQQPSQTLRTMAMQLGAPPVLVEVYDRWIKDLDAQPAVVTALDYFLWLGNGGLLQANIFQAMIGWDLDDGSWAEIAVSALTDLALLRERNGAYEMHALTWEVLRELQRESCNKVLRRLSAFLLSEQIADSTYVEWKGAPPPRRKQPPKISKKGSGILWAWSVELRSSFQGAEDGIQVGLLCLDQRSWLWVWLRPWTMIVGSSARSESMCCRLG